MRRVLLAAGVFLVIAGTALSGYCGDKVFRIGITQIVEHPALDAVRKGFTDYLSENGYKEGKKVEYQYKNAQNNRSVSGLIARKLVGDGVDLILAINLFGPPSHIPTSYIAYSHAVIGHALLRAGDDPHSADVLVEPDLVHYNMIQFKRDELIARGREAMEAKLPELLTLLSRPAG